jgi:hypothetical protein
MTKPYHPDQRSGLGDHSPGRDAPTPARPCRPQGPPPRHRAPPEGLDVYPGPDVQRQAHAMASQSGFREIHSGRRCTARGYQSDGAQDYSSSLSRDPLLAAPPGGPISTLCRRSTWTKSVGATAKVGAWVGSAGAVEFEALVALRPPSRLTMPTSSVALPSGKDAVAAYPREGRISCPKGQKEGKLAKRLARKLTKVGKKSAPVSVAVLVAGSLPGRSPTTMLAPTSALKKRR